MMFSTKGRYALRVMLDLAQHQGDGLISLREIAARQEISQKYLESIVVVLSKAGLVRSQQGKNGGYRLAKAPQEYTVADILELTDGPLVPVECLGRKVNDCPHAGSCQTLPLWSELDQVVRGFLQSKTLADLMTKEMPPVFEVMPFATVKAVCTSDEKGVQKHAVDEVELVPDHGIAGDAHAGNWHRQVSLLAAESVAKVQEKVPFELLPGAFGENILTEGICLYELPIGTRIKIGDALCELTQIGKECHSACAIRKAAGDCVMPREGVFVKVLEGGVVKAGDTLVPMQG